MSHLSTSQQKAIAKRREPIRHAMDRLKERHFSEMDDDGAELLIGVMTDLCEFRNKIGNINTVTLVNVENDHSHIVDLDMFEDRKRIRVCYDPIENRIRTVFPPQDS